MYLIPIPIPWLILLSWVPWESHGIPVFPIPMHTSSDVTWRMAADGRADDARLQSREAQFPADAQQVAPLKIKKTTRRASTDAGVDTSMSVSV